MTSSTMLLLSIHSAFGGNESWRRRGLSSVELGFSTRNKCKSTKDHETWSPTRFDQHFDTSRNAYSSFTDYQCDQLWSRELYPSYVMHGTSSACFRTGMQCTHVRWLKAWNVDTCCTCNEYRAITQVG
ncbi:hypothetical protein GGR57DRAFT_49877 [Xylariaceae sp. FL1272]|nr:hypothetical protein GGR57DRAFT_49877 [Xylariaceae sp. FL1272]